MAAVAECVFTDGGTTPLFTAGTTPLFTAGTTALFAAGYMYQNEGKIQTNIMT